MYIYQLLSKVALASMWSLTLFCRHLLDYNMLSKTHTGKSMNRSLSPLVFVLVLLLGVVLAWPTQAQTTAEAIVRLTGYDLTTPPEVHLRATGIRSDGMPLDFEAVRFVATQGEEVADVRVVGQERVGTLTIFLVDTPTGVDAQLEAIENVILSYASPGFMQEGETSAVDYTAVYQVSGTTAVPLLPPNEYHNGVRNLFVEPLPTYNGATALIDSIMSILNNLDNIAPNPALTAHVVVISDGTDAVSTQFQRQDVPLTAARLGVPIHTIHLPNPTLSGAQGVTYLEQVALGSGGLYRELDDATGMADIWRRIGSFREQVILSYTPSAFVGGSYRVALSAPEASIAEDEIEVVVPASLPAVTLEIPVESRAIILPEAQEVALNLPLFLRWADGVSRAITQAQVLVNGQVVAELTGDEWAERVLATGGEVVLPVGAVRLGMGGNSVQVAVADEASQRVLSPAVVLVVSQGDEVVVPPLLAGEAEGGSLWRVVVACLLGLVALGVVGWMAYQLRHQPIGERLGLDRLFEAMSTRPRHAMNRGGTTTVIITDDPHAPPSYTAVSQPEVMLQVLASESNVAGPFPLTGHEVRLGRDSQQVDVAFVQDVAVSRVHASLVREERSYRIFDENSMSGTLVNGQIVPEYGTLLFGGDEIVLGTVRLRFENRGG